MIDSRSKPKLAVVLWNGVVGGAETHSIALAEQMRRLGAAISIVFIEQPGALAGRLSDMPIPYRSLGLSRGRDVLRHPRTYAAEVARAGPDGALLMTCGYMGAALRAGGYAGPIVGVEHGDILEAEHYPQPRRALWRLARIGGAWADDVEVAVSDFTLGHLREHPHTGAGRRIYNGVDPDRYAATNDAGNRDECLIAFAGRLVRGKGPDYLIKAVTSLRQAHPIRLVIAGEGPERPRLESLARSLGLDQVVEFAGLRHDMPRFWQRCDIAVVPSAEFLESCPMTPLEAMASGKPVIATRNGGLPELVVDGVTGTLVPSGDAAALAKALAAYVGDEGLRLSHGASGRLRVIESFSINRCAAAYLNLFDEFAKK
jgi:glycosyltransferase involved in cell wall biosynthesis